MTRSAVTRSAVDPMTGRVLDGRYQVGPRVARGGMATVYEARDLRLDRLCAVKVMHSGLGDDEDFAARFVREARTAARLSHPNVVAVFDQGEDHAGGERTLFLVMEYVAGHTLRDEIREEAPIAPARALDLLDPVLSALAAAHRSGMIHRDVKPENVLIADDGRVKVADFGLARAVSAETQHTTTRGVLIGTVSYLAPELVVDGRADARSDVYSAGVLLYEMLTGRKPHEGESPIQVAYKHVHEDIPAPSLLVRSGIPPYLDALVARATARDRERRPADARVLQHQLHRVRAALEAGLVDDPELTADLLPAVPVVQHESIDYTDETPTLASADVSGGGAPAPPGSDEVTTVIARGTTTLPAPTTPQHQAPPSGPARPPVPPPRAGAGATATRRPRRSVKGPVALVLVLALTVLAGYAGWYLGIGRYTTTPGLINLSLEQAEAKLARAGLDLEVARRSYSETVAAGSVISTDPSAGSRVVEGGTVEAVVSRGPERYPVPRLKGVTVDEAQSRLADSRLALGAVTEVYHEEIGEGRVISSTPSAGEEVRRDTGVDLRVSKGPRPIPVPDLVGKAADRAEARLTRLGFEVTRETEHSETVAKGRVISQSPDSGTGFRGDPVRLVVSEGPPLVEVPEVFRMGVEAARERLEAAGFEVEVRSATPSFGLGFVVRQSPGGGELAPKGSTVTVYLV